MSLTAPQQATLKAFIDADPVLSLFPNDSDGAFSIAEALQAIAVPAFWVWRTSVEKKEVLYATSRNATVFSFVGNGFISRAAGEFEAWAQLFNATQTCNPSLPNVRQAFQDIFSGAGNAAANRAHLDVISRRAANRLEKLFATGGGLDTSVGAGTMVIEGALTYQDVQQARSLP